jgi:hypothetical protein
MSLTKTQERVIDIPVVAGMILGILDKVEDCNIEKFIIKTYLINRTLFIYILIFHSLFAIVGILSMLIIWYKFLFRL